MTITEWLAMATVNARTRGLPDLVPALEGLAKATQQLRAADWNENPSTPLTAAAAAANVAQDRPDDDN